jgi:hypothetical protein
MNARNFPSLLCELERTVWEETLPGQQWKPQQVQGELFGGAGESSASPIDLLWALETPRGLEALDDVASEVVRSTRSSFNKFERLPENDLADSACVMMPRASPHPGVFSCPINISLNA